MSGYLTNDRLQSFFALDWNLYKEELARVEERSDAVSYNIMTVSTYTGHLENYHSDVWRFLLDSEAGHKKGNHFLSYFAQYLVDNSIIGQADASLFTNAKVYREKGRIDILIVNEKRKICIIIENKINNATDQHNQLERYHQMAKENNWRVAATLYISLTGTRLTTIEDPTVVVHPIAAFDNTQKCLANGWLLTAKRKLTKSDDEADEHILSFIHQYCMLLKHLAIKNMDNEAIKVLYEMVNTKVNFDTAISIQEGLDEIRLHRATLFKMAMEQHFGRSSYFSPGFKKMEAYEGYNWQMGFLGLSNGGATFRLAVTHLKDHTKFSFFNQSANYTIGQLTELLTSIIGDHGFKVLEHPTQIGKTIRMNDGYETLTELDEAVAALGTELFSKFNAYAEVHS